MTTESNRDRAARGGFAVEVDYLNHPAPPPPVYVEVPGVPGNAAFARAREAADRREWEALGVGAAVREGQPSPSMLAAAEMGARLRAVDGTTEGAGAMADGMTVMSAKSGDMQDARQAFERMATAAAQPQPAPAPGQVWAPPPGAVPAECLASEGTVTIVPSAEWPCEGSVGFGHGCGMRADHVTAERGWTCLGVATPHGRVMVGDGFAAMGEDESLVTAVGAGDSVLLRTPNGWEQWTNAGQLTDKGSTRRRTRYAPARPEERYRHRPTGSTLTVLPPAAGDDWLLAEDDKGKAPLRAFCGVKGDPARLDPGVWERLDPGAAPRAADHVVVQLGDREHSVALLPGEGSLAVHIAGHPGTARTYRVPRRATLAGCPLDITHAHATIGPVALHVTVALYDFEHGLRPCLDDGRALRFELDGVGYTVSVRPGWSVCPSGAEGTARLTLMVAEGPPAPAPPLPRLPSPLQGVCDAIARAQQAAAPIGGQQTYAPLPAEPPSLRPIHSIIRDGWTAEVRAGRAWPWDPDRYLVFVTAPDGRCFVDPIAEDGTWAPTAEPQTREQVESFLGFCMAGVASEGAPPPDGSTVQLKRPRWHSDAPGGLPAPTPSSHLDALSRPDTALAPADPDEAARRFFAGAGERFAPRALTGWTEARHPWQMRGR